MQFQIEKDVAAEASAEPDRRRPFANEELETDLQNARRLANELRALPGGGKVRVVERKNEALTRIPA
jgi:hypothetical protein